MSDTFLMDIPSILPDFDKMQEPDRQPAGIELASIWAQDRNRVLGDGKGMVWHVPGDLKFFMSQTTGCPIIMGRRSFEALGGALPNRENIVITRDEDWSADGATVVHSLEDGIKLGKELAAESGAKTAWITGGAGVYEQAMPLVSRLVITSIDLEVPEEDEEGNPRPLVHAPELDPDVWVRDVEHSDVSWNEQSGDARWRVTTWVRR